MPRSLVTLLVVAWAILALFLATFFFVSPYIAILVFLGGWVLLALVYVPRLREDAERDRNAAVVEPSER